MKLHLASTVSWKSSTPVITNQWKPGSCWYAECLESLLSVIDKVVSALILIGIFLGYLYPLTNTIWNTSMLFLPLLFKYLHSANCLAYYFLISTRPETQHRGPAALSENEHPEQEEEILGSDDDEQEDPNDYCKGENLPFYIFSILVRDQQGFNPYGICSVWINKLICYIDRNQNSFMTHIMARQT